MKPQNIKTPVGEPQKKQRLNFLLVDDDDICLFIHRRVLELTGYCSSALSASNGRSALEVLKRAAEGTAPFPDIILLDLDMPLMNGLSFLEAFRDLQYPDKQRIAIVLLTSSISERDRAYATAMGVRQCMSKPLTRENLIDFVESTFQ